MRDNPALRLHAVLSQLRNINGGTTVWVAWSMVFGLDPGETEEMLYAAAAVVALPAEVEAAVRRSSDMDEDLDINSWKPGVVSALSYFANSGSTLAAPLGTYDIATLANLSHVARLIRSEDRVLDDSTLNQVTESLQEIRDLLEQATDLHPILRERLLQVIHGLLTAIRLVHVAGAGGVEKAMLQGIGVVASDLITGGQTFKQPASGWAARFNTILGTLAQMVGIAKTSVEITQGITTINQIGPGV